MHWTEKYLCPLIEKDRFSFKKLTKIIKDDFNLLIHALSFHEKPRLPINELPSIDKKDEEFAYIYFNRLYDDSNLRIDRIEEKAFQLLSYITAIIAFEAIILPNIANVIARVLIIASFAFLTLCIVISLRCVNIKGRRTIFIADVYYFDEENTHPNFNKANVSRAMRDAAIYNHNVADNSADLLKASRFVLICSIMLLISAVSTSSINYITSTEKTTNINITNSFDTIEKQLTELNKNLSGVSEDVNDRNYYKIKELESRNKVLDDKITALEEKINKLDKKK